MKYYFGLNQMFTQTTPLLQMLGGGGSFDSDAGVPSSWYLTRIVYPNTKDTVNFNYVQESYNYYDLPPAKANHTDIMYKDFLSYLGKFNAADVGNFHAGYTGIAANVSE